MNRYFKSQFDPRLLKTEMEIQPSDIYKSDRPLFLKLDFKRQQRRNVKRN